MVVLIVVDISGRVSCNDIRMHVSCSNSRSSIITVVLIVISRSGYSSCCSKVVLKSNSSSGSRAL